MNIGGFDYSYEPLSACCVPESKRERWEIKIADLIDLQMRDHREGVEHWNSWSRQEQTAYGVVRELSAPSLHEESMIFVSGTPKGNPMTQNPIDVQNTAIPAWWSVSEAMTISVAVLIFGLIISLVIAYLIAKGKPAEQLLRTFGTILIVISAVFLVVAGYSDQQIAPVVGLLGTVAGYLLGRSSTNPPSS